MYCQVANAQRFVRDNDLVELFETMPPEQKVERLRGLYLMVCFQTANIYRMTTQMLSPDGEDDEMAEEVWVCCDTCGKLTEYSDDKMLEHDYGGWCLEEQCLNQVIQQL